MSDLISRQALLDEFQKHFTVEEDMGIYALKLSAIKQEVNCVIMGLPSAERKGKWIHDPDPDAGLGWYTCSECGHNDYEDPDFCPNCGADMRGEEDE